MLSAKKLAIKKFSIPSRIIAENAKHNLNSTKILKFGKNSSI